jgi:DNA-binding MarR family transcriptional regulator
MYIMYAVIMKAERQAVLDRLFEIAARLGDLMAAALSEHGLTQARAEALLVLHHLGGPVVQRQLADALRCTPRHVTALADVLETGGWIARRPHPADRRATLISLTGKGEAAVTWIEGERHSAADRLLAGIPARDLTGFLTVTDHILRHIDAPHAAASSE